MNKLRETDTTER